jgi:ribosomal protein L16/L10AE
LKVLCTEIPNHKECKKGPYYQDLSTSEADPFWIDSNRLKALRIDRTRIFAKKRWNAVRGVRESTKIFTHHSTTLNRGKKRKDQDFLQFK